VEEDFVEKEGGNFLGSNCFLSKANNHPLSKAMVNCDQKRIEAVQKRKVGDKVTG
jgi:hypothetical protein